MSREAGKGIQKRSLTIAGHRTSISLEAAFWDALQDLARERNASIQRLVAGIDADRGEQNLSSAIRVHVLETALADLRKLRGQEGVGPSAEQKGIGPSAEQKGIGPPTEQKGVSPPTESERAAP